MQFKTTTLATSCWVVCKLSGCSYYLAYGLTSRLGSNMYGKCLAYVLTSRLGSNMYGKCLAYVLTSRLGSNMYGKCINCLAYVRWGQVHVCIHSVKACNLWKSKPQKMSAAFTKEHFIITSLKAVIVYYFIALVTIGRNSLLSPSLSKHASNNSSDSAHIN